MTAAWRLCAVVPTFDNPRTVGAVVDAARGHGVEVVLVDDGSGPEGERVCAEIGAAGRAHLSRLAANSGKGAAVQRGFEVARELGFTHVLQIDADGQHDTSRVPTFVAASRDDPSALVLGYPEYDTSAPGLRRRARGITGFWVRIEVGGRDKIRDAMIGFRVYPLVAVARLPRLGKRMDFDIEIAVRLVIAGTPTINLPVAVRYLTSAEGGVSHFQPFRDNVRFAWLHTRLCTAASFRWLGRLVTGGRR